jgi:5-methylcytosine-specific restriction endonuclease McrA
MGQEQCPLCKRPIIYGSDHHLVPKCRGGKEKLPICSDCHRTIHSLFTNKQLEKEFNTIEALMTDERMRKAVAFLAKQDPHRRYRPVLSKERRRSGRNG